MSEFSGKNVKELREAYSSIYSQTDDNEVISEEIFEEELFESFYAQVEEELKLFVKELSEETLNEGPKIDLNVVGRKLWNIARPIIKQTTGLGAQPTTRTGRAVRAVQQATVLPTAVANPGGSRDIAVGAVTGAVKGAFQGGSEAAGKKEQQQTQKSSSSDLVVPSGYEIGPDGKPRRRQ